MKFRYIILITFELGICSENYTIYHILFFFVNFYFIYCEKRGLLNIYKKN